MTLKEFEDVKTGKSVEEYEEWFDERSWFAVNIGGIEQPCIKLTTRKVGLRDGSIYVNDKDKELRRLEESEKHALQYRYKMLRIYDEIEVTDRFSIQVYLDLLKRKSDMEREVRRREALPEGTIYCSFCGKSQDEVKKIIGGPVSVFICDECIDICSEILEEEFENESGV